MVARASRLSSKWGSQLAEGQLVSINLGLHNGVMRELKGRPVLISPPRAKQARISIASKAKWPDGDPRHAQAAAHRMLLLSAAWLRERRSVMSLFETLKKAIFHNPLAKQSATHSSPATAKPASTTRVGSSSAPASAPAAKPASASTPSSTSASTSASAPAHASTTAAPASAAAPATVDVEQVLEGLNAKSSQKLNWQTSIVDLMKLVGIDSSLQNRKSLAAELGYTGDTNDSAAMNIWLAQGGDEEAGGEWGKAPASLQ